MKKRIEDLKVVENRRLNNEFFVLKLQSESGIPEILPGQFAEVRIGDPSLSMMLYPVKNAWNYLLRLRAMERQSSQNLSQERALI